MDFEKIDSLTNEQIDDLFDENLNTEMISVTCYRRITISCSNGRRGTWDFCDTRSSSYCHYCEGYICNSVESLCGGKSAWGTECCP